MEDSTSLSRAVDSVHSDLGELLRRLAIANDIGGGIFQLRGGEWQRVGSDVPFPQRRRSVRLRPPGYAVTRKETARQLWPGRGDNKRDDSLERSARLAARLRGLGLGTATQVQFASCVSLPF